MNVGIGSDDTLYATADGVVQFKKYSKANKIVSVVPTTA
jgi:ribosomal protein L27